MEHPKYMVIVGLGDIEGEGNNRHEAINLCNAQRKPARVENANGDVIHRNRLAREADEYAEDLRILKALKSILVEGGHVKEDAV